MSNMLRKHFTEEPNQKKESMTGKYDQKEEDKINEVDDDMSIQLPKK